MPKNFILHTQFESKRETLLAILGDFNNQGEDVVKGERNSIKKVVVDGQVFNIKQFKNPNAFQSLVYRFLRKSKARRSFEYASKLIELGIKTPAPVAYFEEASLGLKESFYISEHIDYDFDFRVLNHNPKWPNRSEILEQFAEFTFQMHENDINFLDHSPGNTLINKNVNGSFDFYLIDLNRMRFQTMSFEKRMENFRRLWLSKTMINVMAPVYAELCGKTKRQVHDSMTFYSKQFQKKVNSKKIRKRKR